MFIIIALVSSCNDYLPGFNFKSFNGTPAEELSKAVENENLEEIEAIVRENRQLIDYLDPQYGHSLLMLSVANDLEKSADKLLELGADPNKRSRPPKGVKSEITTPVLVSCNKVYKGNCKTVILEMLIKNGGDINEEIEVKYLHSNYKTKETPLMIATESDCINLVKKLIELGADINDYDYVNGKGPLSNCVVHDNLGILEYLVIEKKAKIPPYVFIRPEYKGTPREELTLIEFLKEQKYPEKSNNRIIKKKILDYLNNEKL